MPEYKSELPEKIVDITSPGWNSRLGRYFIGQTGELSLSEGLMAWGAVINPRHSGIDLYFDIFTITNFGEQSLIAKIWLNAEMPSQDSRFSRITPSNQSIIPPPRPKAYMAETDRLTADFHGGVNIFDRIVPPNSTLVSDSHQGSIIVGPGGSFSIQIKAQDKRANTATIVLTWWEEKAGANSQGIGRMEDSYELPFFNR